MCFIVIKKTYFIACPRLFLHPCAEANKYDLIIVCQHEPCSMVVNVLLHKSFHAFHRASMEHLLGTNTSGRPNLGQDNGLVHV